MATQRFEPDLAAARRNLAVMTGAMFVGGLLPYLIFRGTFALVLFISLGGLALFMGVFGQLKMGHRKLPALELDDDGFKEHGGRQRGMKWQEIEAAWLNPKTNSLEIKLPKGARHMVISLFAHGRAQRGEIIEAFKAHLGPRFVSYYSQPLGF